MAYRQNLINVNEKTIFFFWLQPNNRIYESLGIFCPTDKLECLDLVETEDILLDWSDNVYLNFTHIDIMNRIENFYENRGKIVERIRGDIYVCNGSPDQFELCCLPSDEVVMKLLTVDNVKAIHDLYPAGDIESVEVFEKLIDKLPGFGVFSLPTGELAAWMAQSYYGAMFSMQTRLEFRRKG